MIQQSERKLLTLSSANVGQVGGLANDTAPKPTATRAGEGDVEQAPGATISGVVVPMENADPLKRRLVNPGRRGLIARLLRWLGRRINAPRYMTAEERAQAKEVETRKALTKLLIAESKVAESRLSNGLATIGLCYRTKDKTKKVTFDKICAEPNAIWLRVNTRRLPFGVSCDALVSQEAVNHLGYVVGHAVTARTDFETGVWYIVERASGRMGIPNHVALADLWERMPASADALAIPVGITNNSRPVYVSLREMIHCLVAGTTGSGKSNQLNVMICTLIRRNKPERLKLCLVDLKGGLEFKRYRGVPHLLNIPAAPDGIVSHREDVEGLLDWLIAEGERRMAILDSAGAQNIGQYNQGRRKNSLPAIVVVIDEWADVRMASSPRKIEERLVNIVQRMRAVGVHVILATQIPKAEVIGTLIVGNLPAKIAFGMPTITASKTVLGNGHAFGLSPVGRCILQLVGEREIQTPFISRTLIDDTIQGASTGQFGVTSQAHDVTPEEIYRWAVMVNSGWCSVRDVYTAFKDRGITRAEVEAILQSGEEADDLVIDSSLYRMVANAGTRGRRLISIEHD